MANVEWSQEILKQLDVRDGFEKKDGEIFVAFQDIIAKLNQQNLQLQGEETKELEQTQERVDKLIASLNASAMKVEKLELIQVNNEKTIANLNKSIIKANNKIESLNLELREKNKTIEIINDELLMLQMQKNILNQKMTELSLENESLIQRWMDKVSKDAEKLNDANQFLQSFQKEK
jgi:chromosome segregation ATPase